MSLWARPESQTASRLAIEGATAEDETVPIRRSFGRYFTPDVQHVPIDTPVDINTLLQHYLQHHRSPQRHRRTTGYPMNEFWVEPLFKLNNWEGRVLRLQPKFSSTIQNSENQLFSDVI